MPRFRDRYRAVCSAGGTSGADGRTGGRDSPERASSTTPTNSPHTSKRRTAAVHAGGAAGLDHLPGCRGLGRPFSWVPPVGYTFPDIWTPDGGVSHDGSSPPSLKFCFPLDERYLLPYGHFLFGRWYGWYMDDGEPPAVLQFDVYGRTSVHDRCRRFRPFMVSLPCSAPFALGAGPLRRRCVAGFPLTSRSVLPYHTDIVMPAAMVFPGATATRLRCSPPAPPLAATTRHAATCTTPVTHLPVTLRTFKTHLLQAAVYHPPLPAPPAAQALLHCLLRWVLPPRYHCRTGPSRPDTGRRTLPTPAHYKRRHN